MRKHLGSLVGQCNVGLARGAETTGDASLLAVLARRAIASWAATDPEAIGGKHGPAKLSNFGEVLGPYSRWPLRGRENVFPRGSPRIPLSQ